MSLPIIQENISVNLNVQPASKSNKRHGYLIDMDGVIYRGDKLIPGSDYFIQSLLDKEIPFLFLTNNSQ